MMRASSTSRGSTVKSLRSTGSGTGCSGVGQVGRMGTEELDVGEHRQRGRTAALVGLGHRCCVEVDGEVALRRRPALHLGDHGDVAVPTPRPRARRAGPAPVVPHGPPRATARPAGDRPPPPPGARRGCGRGRWSAGEALRRRAWARPSPSSAARRTAGRAARSTRPWRRCRRARRGRRRRCRARRPTRCSRRRRRDGTSRRGCPSSAATCGSIVSSAAIISSRLPGWATIFTNSEVCAMAGPYPVDPTAPGGDEGLSRRDRCGRSA